VSRQVVVGIALFAAVVGAAGGFFAKPAPPQETRFLNFDPESTPAEALVGGWSNFESDPGNGNTFAWCANQNCSLRLQVRPEGDIVIRARVSAFGFPDAPQQALSVFVNGTPVGTQPVVGEMKIATFKAPRAVWHAGPNDVRLNFVYAVSPKSKFPNAEDARTLAAALDWFELASPPP